MNDKRILSSIVIRDGFARGWAFDPEGSPVTVTLEAEDQVVEGATGFAPGPDDPFEPGPPPRPGCGFSLPLPRALFDGFPHRVVVRVPGWRLPTDPPPRETLFIHGDTFGAVERDGRELTGWVAFRAPRRALPPVIVREREAGPPRLRIPLTADPRRSRDDAAQTARFRIPLERVTMERPLFECSGTALRFDPTLGEKERVTGCLDRIDADYFSGWAVDMNRPTRSVDLDLLVDGRVIHTFRPNHQRDDIAKYAGLSESLSGAYGFRYETPAVLRDGRPHTVSIACARSATLLSGSPKEVLFHSRQLLLAPPERLDPPAPRPPAAERPLVSVVILNRNGREVLEALFDGWRLHNATLPVELIVIDHDSSDDSRGMVERWSARLPIRLIALDRNDSFSASCNLGAAEARGEYLLFLNNDIVWVQDALPAMVATLRDEQVAAVGIKLIKHEEFHLPEVQHLGVRFKLVGAEYWPFEVSPDTSPREREHSAQEVPAVTGAVLLCRKRDFDRVGGFDRRYFYGFEDVEFCLRLAARLDRRIVCRNDLVALHRHGHTRLTGRETEVRDHHGHNSTILREALGLWLKRRMRADLLAGDGLYTTEPLTVGFAVGDNPAFEEEGVTLGEAGRMARRLMAAHPDCRAVALTPDRDWYAVDSIHLLVVCHPAYDLTLLRGARGDLTRVALVSGDPRRWRAQRWWPEFDLRLDGGVTAAAPELLPFDPEQPQRALFDAIGELPRVAILVPCAAEAAAARPEIWRVGEGLRQRLQRGGAAAWLVPRERWDDPPRVADVYIQLHGLEEAPHRRRLDGVNVLWIVAAADRLSPYALNQYDQLWVASAREAQRLAVHRPILRWPLPMEEEEPTPAAADGQRGGAIELHLPAAGERTSLIAGAPGGVYEVRHGLLSPRRLDEAKSRLPERLLGEARVVHLHQAEADHAAGYGSLWMWLAHRMGAEVRLSPRPAAGAPPRPVPAARWEPPAEEEPAHTVEGLRALLAERLHAAPAGATADDGGDTIRRGTRAVLEGIDGHSLRAS